LNRGVIDVVLYPWIFMWVAGSFAEYML